MSVQALPIGFAEQVMDLQVSLQEEESLEIVQILSQMYRIAVDYYINCDILKANFFQKKLNNLAVKSLSCVSVQNKAIHRIKSRQGIQDEVQKYEMCQKTYIQAILKNSSKTQIKLQSRIEDDLKKQEDKINGRLLRRVKSSKNL